MTKIAPDPRFVYELAYSLIFFVPGIWVAYIAGSRELGYCLGPALIIRPFQMLGLINTPLFPFRADRFLGYPAIFLIFATAILASFSGGLVGKRLKARRAAG